MIRFLEISNQMLFWYYLATNLAYLVMLIIALKTSARHQRRLESHRLSCFKETPMTPPITIIAPAHNEEGSIRVAIRNLLELDYPELEIIVVNDGSGDRTLEELCDENATLCFASCCPFWRIPSASSPWAASFAY